MANEKTLSYSEGVKGWPYFYTFKYGRLYRHNTNEQRNTYYSVYTPSEITGVFNAEPTTIKLFKTISIESSASWECTNLSTDLGTGIIESSFLNKKKENGLVIFVPL